jgi:DNA-binding NarL/FixJ family response regulator
MSKPKHPPKQQSSSARHTQAETPSRIRLLVADSHDITLAGTYAILKRVPHIKVVARATTAARALAAVDQHTIDLALLELRFADGLGIELCRRIRSSCPNTQVIILTGAIDEESAFSALRAGAAGILFKSVGEAGLVRAIEAVRCGQVIFDRHVFQPLITHFYGLSIQSYGKARVELSDQERQVMSLVAEGKTNKEIAVALGLTNKTVKNRLSNLYEKLHVTRRAQATKMFIERSREAGTFSLTDFDCPLPPPELP